MALTPVSADDVRQWKDDLAKGRQEKKAVRAVFLQTPVSPREREMVQDLEETKGKVLQGQKIHDLSTPADAFLTVISAYYHQDSNTLVQVLPFAGQSSRLSSPELRSKLLENLGQTTICRIEVEDRPPQESDLAAIYTTDSPDKKINQVFMFGYTQGAWRFLGSAFESCERLETPREGSRGTDQRPPATGRQEEPLNGPAAFDGPGGAGIR